MRVSLHLHPDSPGAAVAALEVELACPQSGLLDLHYVLSGEIDRIRIPPPAAPERVGGLWNHTCFEAFFAGDGGSYCEFNLSPSGEWAAWRFEGYRCGMVPLATAPPRIEPERAGDRFELRARIALPAGAHRLALSAVIEEENGTRSYWALTHPQGPPDFHDPACFAVELPPPAQA